MSAGDRAAADAGGIGKNTGTGVYDMAIYTAQEIMDIIPHRYPFLLIDTIEELETGVRALGKKCVSVNEPYFQGHFPGNPVILENASA